MHLNEKEMKLLDEGDIIKLTSGTVLATVPKHFLYYNYNGVFDEFDHGEVNLKDMRYLQGRYVVYKTEMEEGGCGVHDLHRMCGDLAYHVFCEKMDDSKRRIDFYQTGDCTAMIFDLEPIGKTELSYKRV